VPEAERPRLPLPMLSLKVRSIILHDETPRLLITDVLPRQLRRNRITMLPLTVLIRNLQNNAFKVANN